MHLSATLTFNLVPSLVEGPLYNRWCCSSELNDSYVILNPLPVCPHLTRAQSTAVHHYMSTTHRPMWLQEEGPVTSKD